MNQTPCPNSDIVTHRHTKKARSRKKTKASISNPAPYGTMSILPKEIWSSIYACVLAGGDMTLMRTSRYFYMNTKEVLAKHEAYHEDQEKQDELCCLYIHPTAEKASS